MMACTACRAVGVALAVALLAGEGWAANKQADRRVKDADKALAAGQCDEAIAKHREAIGLAPGDPQYLCLAASAALECGTRDHDRAREWLDSAENFASRCGDEAARARRGTPAAEWSEIADQVADDVRAALEVLGTGQPPPVSTPSVPPEKPADLDYGMLVLDVPATAVVKVDGTRRAERQVRLPKGQHWIAVEENGHVPVEVQVPVEANQATDIRVELRKVQPSPAQPCPPMTAAMTPPPARSVSAAPRAPSSWWRDGPLIGGGAAMVATGLVVYILAVKDQSEARWLYNSGMTGAQDRLDGMRRKEIAAYSLWGAGAAAMAAGLVLHFTVPGLTVGATPGGASVGAAF